MTHLVELTSADIVVLRYRRPEKAKAAKMETTKYYSKEIKTPANKKEGLQNFVQMIINRLESNEPREALLTAVDLLNDIQSGIYSLTGRNHPGGSEI